MSATAPWEAFAKRAETLSGLDKPAKAIGGTVRDTLSGGQVKDVLSGTWLGHAVHPMLTDVVIGCFTSATLLDLFGGSQAAPASRRLIALGIAAYAPTAATGANDWADSEAADAAVRRTGLVHAATNALALGLYGASLAARRRGAAGRGKLLGAAGAGVLMAGGYLGGHLSLRRGVGPDQTVFDPGPEDWTPVPAMPDLGEGGRARVVVLDTPVLLTRGEGGWFAIHDRCSHRGCSLAEGELDGEEVVCACHGSRFNRRDGSLVGGPASAPQPSYEVRERAGRLELRRRALGA